MSYRRSKERNKRLKRLYEQTKHSYGSGAWYDDRKDRYIRYYPTNRTGYTKYLRRLSNRRVRRMKEFALNGSQYKKIYDYWWSLL